MTVLRAILLFFQYFIILGTIISLIYFLRNKTKHSKKVFIIFASILGIIIIVFFIIFAMFTSAMLWG